MNFSQFFILSLFRVFLLPLAMGQFDLGGGQLAGSRATAIASTGTGSLGGSPGLYGGNPYQNQYPIYPGGGYYPGGQQPYPNYFPQQQYPPPYYPPDQFQYNPYPQFRAPATRQFAFARAAAGGRAGARGFQGGNFQSGPGLLQGMLQPQSPPLDGAASAPVEQGFSFTSLFRNLFSQPDTPNIMPPNVMPPNIMVPNVMPNLNGQLPSGPNVPNLGGSTRAIRNPRRRL